MGLHERREGDKPEVPRSPGIFLGLCVVEVGSGYESVAVNPLRCHKVALCHVPASFPAVASGTEGRNMRRVNQKGLCFIFFGSEQSAGVRRIRAE